MKRLPFRAAYIDPILSGTKTTTIRRPRAGLPTAGEQFALGCRYDLPPFAYATCSETVEKLPEELTPADAHADGFPCLADLLAAIEKHCADGPDAPALLLPQPLRIIRFQLDSQAVTQLHSDQ